MITLYTFGPYWGLPDGSPFVTKAMILLRMAELDFTENRGGYGKAPKGKLPFIDDDGTVVADSTFIRFHLEQRHGIDFDAGLSGHDRAVAWAVEKMVEDHLYWALVDARWNNPENFSKGPARFFDGLPAPLRLLARAAIRRKTVAATKSHGLGRHTRPEIERLAIRDLDSLATILSDKPFLMGDSLCAADATVAAFVLGLLCPVFKTPIRTAAEGHANLVAYCGRLTARYFGR
jgi:glutathione S-transferase